MYQKEVEIGLPFAPPVILAAREAASHFGREGDCHVLRWAIQFQSCCSQRSNPRSATMAEEASETVPPSSPLREIDRVADSFELQWRNGGEPKIREYLDRV